MGKLKKGRRNQKKRYNPVGKKDGSETSHQLAKDESVRQSKILPLIEKLSSTAQNDRSVALSAISVLADDARMRRLLLEEKLIATIMEQTLHDSNDELVVESLGLLRNLTIEEGYEVAKFLWRSNIWTTIEQGIGKIEKSFHFLQNEEKLSDSKTTYLLYDFIENILSLLVSIASCSDDLYDAVYSKMDCVIKLVIELLNWNIEKLKTTKLFNSLLDFIYEFASASTDFVTSLAQIPSFSLEKLSSLGELPSQNNNHLGRMYIQGIVFHFYEVLGQGEASKTEVCCQVLKRSLEILDCIDSEKMIASLSITDNADRPIHKSKEDFGPNERTVSFGTETPEIIQARSDLHAIEICIDLFAGICEDLAFNDDNSNLHIDSNPSLISLLVDAAYPSYLQLMNFCKQDDSFSHLNSKLLIAFNNLSWLFVSSNKFPEKWLEKIPSLWQAVESFFKSSNLDNQVLALGIFWAISKSVGPEIRSQVTLEDVRSLLKQCEFFTSKAFDDNDLDSSPMNFVLSSVGFLGIVAQVISNVEITKEISQFLLFSVSHFTKSEYRNLKGTEIVLECLNSIYDIFSDAEFDYDYPVFVQGNYLKHLEEFEPQVKIMYKCIDKNKSPELKSQAEQAWTNLRRFIVYKKKERS